MRAKHFVVYLQRLFIHKLLLLSLFVRVLCFCVLVSAICCVDGDVTK